MQNKGILEQKRFAQYPLSKKSKKIFLCKLESLRSLKRENFQTFEYIQTFEYTATSLRHEGFL